MRFSRNKLPAVIAIVAILLLFIAPEVSQRLEQRRMENRDEYAAVLFAQSEPEMHDMAMDSFDSPLEMMNDTNFHAENKLLPHTMGPSALQAVAIPDMSGMLHSSIMEDMACGYCVMLIHLPLMLWIFIAIIWLTIRVNCPPAPRLILQSFTVYFPGIAQPRAPPAY